MRNVTNGELVATIVAVAVLVLAHSDAFVAVRAIKPLIEALGIAVLFGVAFAAYVRAQRGRRGADLLSKPVSDRTGNRIGNAVSLAWFCLAGLLVFAAVALKGWTWAIVFGLLANLGLVLIAGHYLGRRLLIQSLVPYAAASVAGVTVFLLIAALA